MNILHYKTYGHVTNPPLVLIHGIGGSASIFFRQIQYYKKHFYVIALDLPGHGQSYKVESDKKITLDLAVKDILHLLDHLKINQAYFVGVSLGTVIIHHLIHSAPTRVKKAVLAGAITTLDLPSRLLLKVGDIGKKMMPYMWLYRFSARMIMPKKNHAQSRSLFIREARRMGYQQFAKWYKVSTIVNGVYHKTQDISIPKLYVTGKEDHLLYRLVKNDIKKDAHAKFHEIPNCGHVCNLDAPQTFNEVSTSFLLHGDSESLTTSYN